MKRRRPIRVLIATDVRLYGESLQRVLDTHEDVQVVGILGSMESVLDSVDLDEHDMVLLDPAMPGADVLTRALHRTLGDVKTLLLSLSRSESEVVRWAKRGMDGFVTRDNTVDQLVDTIRSVNEGRCRCSPRIASALLRELARQADGRGPTEEDAHLTRREHEVGRLLARGLSNKEIATELGIAVSTTKNHVHNILTKLGLRRRGEVGRWIREHAILGPGR